jgi:hypothetical protein
MKYTVVWRTSAKNRLAEIWLDASDQAAVGAAANRIDLELQRDPQLKGESRSGNRRILIELPLAIVYRIDDADRKVWVTSIRRLPPRS